MVTMAEQDLVGRGLLKPGDVLGVVAGTRQASGSTNLMRLHVVTDEEAERIAHPESAAAESARRSRASQKPRPSARAASYNPPLCRRRFSRWPSGNLCPKWKPRRWPLFANSVPFLPPRDTAAIMLYRDRESHYVLLRHWKSEEARGAAQEDPDMLRCWARLGNEIQIVKVYETLTEK